MNITLKSLKAAAQQLGISRSRMYALKKEIRHYRIGGKILFAEADLQAYLDGCRVEPSDQKTHRPRRVVQPAIKRLRLE